jgi:hypothetical protein
MNRLKIIPLLRRRGFFYFSLDNRAMRIPPRDRSTTEGRSLTSHTQGSVSDGPCSCC